MADTFYQPFCLPNGRIPIRFRGIVAVMSAKLAGEKSTIHLPTVAAGLAPGGIWVRICTDDEVLITEYALFELAAR